MQHGDILGCVLSLIAICIGCFCENDTHPYILVLYVIKTLIRRQRNLITCMTTLMSTCSLLKVQNNICDVEHITTYMVTMTDIVLW